MPQYENKKQAMQAYRQEGRTVALESHVEYTKEGTPIEVKTPIREGFRTFNARKDFEN